MRRPHRQSRIREMFLNPGPPYGRLFRWQVRRCAWRRCHNGRTSNGQQASRVNEKGQIPHETVALLQSCAKVLSDLALACQSALTHKFPFLFHELSFGRLDHPLELTRRVGSSFHRVSTPIIPSLFIPVVTCSVLYILLSLDLLPLQGFHNSARKSYDHENEGTTIATFHLMTSAGV